jgi:hypothetical protein
MTLTVDILRAMDVQAWNIIISDGNVSYKHRIQEVDLHRNKDYLPKIFASVARRAAIDLSANKEQIETALIAEASKTMAATLPTNSVRGITQPKPLEINVLWDRAKKRYQIHYDHARCRLPQVIYLPTGANHSDLYYAADQIATMTGEDRTTIYEALRHDCGVIAARKAVNINLLEQAKIWSNKKLDT